MLAKKSHLWLCNKILHMMTQEWRQTLKTCKEKLRAFTSTSIRTYLPFTKQSMNTNSKCKHSFYFLIKRKKIWTEGYATNCMTCNRLSKSSEKNLTSILPSCQSISSRPKWSAMIINSFSERHCLKRRKFAPTTTRQWRSLTYYKKRWLLWYSW